MIRNDLKNLKDEEVEKIVGPTREFIIEYLKDFLLDDIIAMDIANRINNNALWVDDFKSIISSTIEDIFYQLDVSDCDFHNIKSILESEYKIKIIKENPLKIMNIAESNH